MKRFGHQSLKPLLNDIVTASCIIGLVASSMKTRVDQDRLRRSASGLIWFCVVREWLNIFAFVVRVIVSFNFSCS